MKLFNGVLGILVVGLLLTFTNATAGQRVVNCDKGGSLQSAIESGAGSAELLEIQLLGTCHEEFDFSRDRVNIFGDGNTTIVGNIRMFTSDTVNFADLTITGPGPGLSLYDGRARLTRVNISGNEGVGVYGRQGAVIMLKNSQVNDNRGGPGFSLQHSYLLLINTQVIGNMGDGIVATQNSSVSLRNTTVHANHGSGVFANLNSVVVAINSHIEGNHGIGVFVRGGSSGEIHDCTVNSNGQQGLMVAGKSMLDVHRGMVEGNNTHGSIVVEHSFLRLVDAQLRVNHGHGLIIGRDGGAVLEGHSTIEDNTDENFQVVCDGKEASIDVLPSAHAGSIGCPDPDF